MNMYEVNLWRNTFTKQT